jgi:hypothetical protein
MWHHVASCGIMGAMEISDTAPSEDLHVITPSLPQHADMASGHRYCVMTAAMHHTTPVPFLQHLRLAACFP